ncbi:MAG: hypothetical protein NDF52_05740, partial [archaeon YNP-WB-062]|nr:hypothetical protein [Candidatus Culexarchaeum yellowstonense]
RFCSEKIVVAEFTLRWESSFRSCSEKNSEFFHVFLVFFCGSVVFGVLVGGGGLVFVVCPGCGKLMSVDVDCDGLVFCVRCGVPIIVWFVGGESIFRCRVCGFVGYVSRVEVEVEVL